MTIRERAHGPRSAAGGLIVLAAALGGGPGALAQQTRASNMQLLKSDTDGAPEWIGDTELIKAVRDQLVGRANNLHLVFANCESAGFAGEAKRLLTGNFSATAARGFDKEWEFRTNINQIQEGKRGLDISSVQYAHGWGPQYVRAFDTDRNRSARQLFDFAKDNDYFAGANTSVFEFGGDGDASTIRPALGGGTFAVVSPEAHTRISDLYLPKAIDRALHFAGYTNATIQMAYRRDQGTNVQDVPVDFSASKDALFRTNGIIDAMRAYVDQDEGARSAGMYFDAHGASTVRKVDKQPGATPGAPKQGRSITPGSGNGMMSFSELDRRAFFDDFAEDDPYLDRMDGSRPVIFVTTSEELYAGPVDVLIDGIGVGQIQMLGLLDGAMYQLDIEDGPWAALHAAGFLDDLAAEITFEFGAGSFRVATEWDRDLGDLTRFGVELGGPAIYGIPASGTAAVVLLGGVLAARRRRGTGPG
jgi:hypothetical protein